jgi:predicted nucleic acid-binding protein
MKYVIDCSFSSALFLPDENSDNVRNFFLNFKKNDIILVPQLWWYETNNVLNISLRRKRLDKAAVLRILELINVINIETDSENGIIFTKNVFEISQFYNLSSYDAVYLELASRKKAKLMTLDDELTKAAKKAGLTS